jgi:ketosteroid isomerase-like protein
MGGAEAEIRALLDLFKQASAAGDADTLAAVFHSNARLVGTAYDNGVASSYDKVTKDFVLDYQAQPLAKGYDGKPLPTAKTYSAHIESLHVHGPDTAVAIVREDHGWGDQSFIDILSLWKEQGKGWLIVHKTFTQFPTPA